ncbi:uncharacterized protein MONBRDRAFT_38997 [Monosiga brevicollis MX1]|uniref:ATP synthase subunit b n=1 Tax=Monosiga brevicollis TaxID=81824 RepID=A9VBI9_MONBE|nr:uncharacterized protein MONBRDRAFT_38997 [Monosiga brevicollis MX1]EDQ85106.1 predicted protein [Monosiga brevicollis MX1]|eukprot:XP_001750110.1 hypothetical protein [Monosiga brevicollis MX1]
MAALRALQPLRSAAQAGPVSVLASRGLKISTPQQSALLESKTGKTGAAVLGFGLAAYLASKEILILHSETVVVASIAAVTYGLMSKAGKDIASGLDERAQAIQEGLEKGRVARIAAIEKEIAQQEQLKASVSNLQEIYDVNRELASATRELAYRTELHAARDNALANLKDMVAIEQSQRQAEQNEIANWIEAEVLKALEGKEEALMKQSIADLEDLAKAQA